MFDSGDLDQGKKAWRAPLGWVAIAASVVVLYLLNRFFHFNFWAGYFLLFILILLFTKLRFDHKRRVGEGGDKSSA